MNDIDTMPTKCHDCPYWEICKEPYVCQNDAIDKKIKSDQIWDIYGIMISGV